MKYTVESFEEEFSIIPIEMIGFLKQVKQKRSNTRFGICYNLSKLIERKYEQLEYTGYDLVRKFSTNWRYHSGNIDYPVPSSLFEEVDFWKDKKLKYRLDLIDYIIGQLKEVKQ